MSYNINEYKVPDDYLNVPSGDQVETKKISINKSTNSPTKDAIINNTLNLLPTIIATILYLITLSGCTGTQFECLTKYSLGTLKIAVYIIILSSFFYAVQFYLYFIKITKFSHTLICLLLILFLCFVYDTGADFYMHGSYNRIMLLPFIFVWLFFLSLLHCIVCYSKLRGFIIFSIIFIMIYIAKITFDKAAEKSCNGWSAGFKNTTIDIGPEHSCKILPPKICYFQIFHGVFDMTKIFRETCRSDTFNKFSTIKPYIPESVRNATIIGYPRTENWSIFPESMGKNFQRLAMQRVVDMNKVDNITKDKTEVTVDFSNKNPEMKINLKRNETLAKERKQLFDQFIGTPFSKNVIYVFIDSLSRVNFKRKLPLLYQWIENKYILKPSSAERDKKNHKFESFSFLKYHGVGMYTGVNMVPTFFGVFNDDYSGYYYLNYYKKRGFITGQSTACCNREVFDIEHGAIEKMTWETYDHELISAFCDNNASPYNNQYSILLGANSIRKRCLYGKNVYEYSLEYLRQFFQAYKSESKIFRLSLEDAHEGSNEVMKYSDQRLVEFFIQFEKDGLLDDTTIFFQADHGVAMLGPYSAFELEDYKHELVLPAFFIIIPTSIQNYKDVRETLRHNQNSIVTPFNIYNSLISFLDNKDDKGKADNSLYSNEDSKFDIFLSKIPKNRDCENAFHSKDYFSYNEYICRCQK